MEQERNIPDSEKNFTAPTGESSEAKDHYTNEPIQWPENFPKELLEQLPSELRNGSDITSTIAFQRDADGRIVSATYSTEETRNPSTFPDNFEKQFTFTYDSKGNPTRVDFEKNGIETMMYPSTNPGERYTQKGTIKLKWHTFGDNSGSLKHLEVTYK